MNHKITLSYVDGNGVTQALIQLKDPEFGNKDAYKQNRLQRNDRGGDLIIFFDSTWPTEETLSVSFKYLNEKDSQSLINFMQFTQGTPIFMRDIEDRLWLGIIKNPESPTIHEGRHNHSCSFEFVGVLMPE